MEEQFYTILTEYGKSEITKSIQSGVKTEFVTLALGDGSGNYNEPTETDTELVNEVYRGEITSVEIDEVNPNWIRLTMIIPGTTGGFMIREVGVFDEGNKMLAVGKYPETYKPIIENGSSKELTINMILEVSNAEAVEMQIDPSVVIATKQDLSNLADDIRDEIEQHKSSKMPHRIVDTSTSKTYEYGYQISLEGKPQLIYKEVL